MQKISGHFPQTRRAVLEGQEATPVTYLASNPAQFSYLHFVAHGTASQTRPLESAVIPTSCTHGRSSSTRLARSCVPPAGTRAYVGEGLVGLRGAFLRAGARNVIASLWEVSDASSTPQLMDRLYEGLDRGEDPATALRNATIPA